MSWHRPPRALRKAKLDNIAIVPASLLPEKARYQAIANGLPQGDVLVILPHAAQLERTVLERTAQLFEAKGHRVTRVDEANLGVPSPPR